MAEPDPASVLTRALESLAGEDLFALPAPALLDRIRLLVTAQNRLAAELARTVRRAELAQAAQFDGLQTMPSWLRGHARLSPSAAAQLVRNGRALEALPALAEAAVQGRVTAEQVAVLATLVRPEHLTRAEEQNLDVPRVAALLTELATGAPHADLVQAVAHYLARLDPDGPEPDPTAQRALTMVRHADGRLSGRLEPPCPGPTGSAAPVCQRGGMATRGRAAFPSWTTVVPFVALLVLGVSWGRHLSEGLAALVAVVLVGSVLAAVHHAEVVAHKVGEPFGSLILAVAVTIIEVGLIVTLMVSGGPETAGLARDTVFAAVMITCNGIAGLSLLLGARRHGVVAFNAEGTGALLATVTTVSVMSLVVPTFTTSEPGPQFSPPQLAFAAVSSLVLYGALVLTQTVRHRDFFLPVAPDGGAFGDRSVEHAEPPTGQAAVGSLGLLVVALVAVVGLAKVLSPAIEQAVAAAGFPQAVVGVVIALLVLLPETLAAARAALRNRVQISLNLAFGSAMASIGLTIPAIAVATIWVDRPLLLGLGATQMVLLAVTVVVAALTVVPGRATRLQGVVHLVLLAGFLFLAVNP